MRKGMCRRVIEVVKGVIRGEEIEDEQNMVTDTPWSTFEVQRDPINKQGCR